MPKFNSISISGYHMQEAGATADLEMAYTLADGLEYVRTGLKAGIDIDAFAPRLSFFWAQGKNFFMEIAKMRAARALWAKLIAQFNPKNPKSMALRTHSQTSGWSLTEQDPFNNVARTCIEAMAAAFGHTQSLHTNSLDEAIALPTDFSARIARNTHFSCRKKPAFAKSLIPWGGSYFVEALTQALMKRAWAHIQEVEALGGMAKAIETGLPKLRIEEAAARRQARIDSGKESIIGVNLFRLEKAEKLDVRKWTTPPCANPKSSACKNSRPNATGQSPGRPGRPHRAAETGAGNLLALAIEAARARATLGEISFALEKIFRRHKAVIRSVSGVYQSEFGQDPQIEQVRRLTDDFARKQGRRPRILIAKMGQDGHDRGAKVIATAYADLGFDVDIGPLFQQPDEAARMASENDVHVSASVRWPAATKRCWCNLVEELGKIGRSDIMVVVGGVIPPQDYDFLKKNGAAAVFGPGTFIPDAAKEMINLTPVQSARVDEQRKCNRASKCLDGGGLRRRRSGRRPRHAGPRHHADRKPVSLARKKGQEVLQRCCRTPAKARRIGITGVPGVGKSTFIEAFGCYLIQAGPSVAVLTIDPPANVPAAAFWATKPAWKISAANRAPSSGLRPPATIVGGVARRTRETMLLVRSGRL
jgi:methylmalonyl-CoA mutase